MVVNECNVLGMIFHIPKNKVIEEIRDVVAGN